MGWDEVDREMDYICRAMLAVTQQVGMDYLQSNGRSLVSIFLIYILALIVGPQNSWDCRVNSRRNPQQPATRRQTSFR